MLRARRIAFLVLLVPANALAQQVAFDMPTAYAVPYRSRAVAVADFNGDSIPDLAVTHY